MLSILTSERVLAHVLTWLETLKMVQNCQNTQQHKTTQPPALNTIQA